MAMFLSLAVFLVSTILLLISLTRTQRRERGRLTPRQERRQLRAIHRAQLRAEANRRG